MAIPNVPNNTLLKVRIAAKNEGQYGLNILHYFTSGAAGDPVSIADVVRALDNNLPVALIEPTMCSIAKHWGIGAQIRDTVPYAEYYCALARGFGTSGDHLLPTQAAAIISFRTAFRGAAGRGRMYKPFLSTDEIEDTGELTSTALTVLDSYGNALITQTVNNAGATGSITLKLVVTGAAETPLTNVESILIRSYLGTQRRRAEINRGDQDPFAGSIPVF